MESVSLKEYFESKLADKDKALDAALAAAKEAVSVAEKNAEKWRQNANEWRGAMDDREKLFVHRKEFEEYRASMDKILAAEKESKATWITKFIGWIIAIVAIALAYMNKVK